MIRHQILFILLLLFTLSCKKQNEIKKQTETKKENTMNNDEPRVTVVGGIFFKTKNPDKTKEWYQNNLGLNTDKWEQILNGFKVMML